MQRTLLLVTKQRCDYIILKCTTCSDISLFSKLDGEDWSAINLLWPESERLDSSVAKAVAQNYIEAKRVQNVSQNAFAVLLRRALEALCDDRGVTKGNLANRLKELAERGEIPERLAKITTVLRTLGNAGAHHSELRVTIPMTWTMDKFFRVLIEYVYVAPSKLSEFEQDMKKDEAP